MTSVVEVFTNYQKKIQDTCNIFTVSRTIFQDFKFSLNKLAILAHVGSGAVALKGLNKGCQTPTIVIMKYIQ
jgi:hypothetical protein